MRRILLVRHGECDANLSTLTRITGQTVESPLTPLGQQQARALGKHFSKVASWSGCALPPVFSSTAVRTIETAKIITHELQHPDHQILQAPELLEVCLGAWEGQERASCYTADVMAEIQRDPFNFTPPGGESLREVEERMTRYIRRHVLPQVQRNGPPALVVSHGLAIKCFLRGLLNADPTMLRKFELANTSITEVVWAEVGSMQGWNIIRVNDKSHLLLEGLC